MAEAKEELNSQFQGGHRRRRGEPIVAVASMMQGVGQIHQKGN
jgi:hypothetical protein